MMHRAIDLLSGICTTGATGSETGPDRQWSLVAENASRSWFPRQQPCCCKCV